jgi:tetratricopeptide (TPR) repeat protein
MKQIYTLVLLAALASLAEATEQATPQSADAFLERGILFASQGDLNAAIADFAQAIRLDRNFTAAYYNRGNAYAKKGNHDMAIADYTIAIWLDPEHSDAYLGRGNAYRKKREHSKADEDHKMVSLIATSQAAPTPTPTSTLPTPTPAITPSTTPEPVEAAPSEPAKVAKRTLKPKEAKALYNASRASYFRAEYAIALDGFKEIYELLGSGEMAENSLYWMGLIMQDSGLKEDAKFLFKELLEKFPHSQKVCPVNFKLAGIAEEDGNKAEQTAYLQKLVETKRCAHSNEFQLSSDKLVGDN